MTETHTEWATEMTWPDGHTETREGRDRRYAETATGFINDDKDTDATAVLVCRTVTVTGWAPVPRASAVGVTI